MNLNVCCVIILFFLVTACRKDRLDGSVAEEMKLYNPPFLIPEGNPLSQGDLDKFVVRTLESKNDFRWEWMDLKITWSALQYNDHSLAIGYQASGVLNFQNDLKTMNIHTGSYKVVHDEILKLIEVEQQRLYGDTVTRSYWLVEDDSVLPIITVRTTDKILLTKLANLRNVRYLEPLDYHPASAVRSGSGCGGSTEPLNNTDYTTYSPSCLVPWNYSASSIPQAWNYSQGQGITIGVIDAGISSAQPLLGTQFNSGFSTGRLLTVAYSYGGSAYTSCVHGTSMCGLAAGPRNALTATCGVAYKANLHFIRACDDVLLTSSGERLGVKNALISLANQTSVRIISLSIGTPFSSGVLKDGVDYAYAQGKLIFAAAGTSFSWTSWSGVIYPAAYTSCVAVTGTKEDGSTCSDCHDGSAVQFTIVMERNLNSDRNTLSLPPNTYAPTYVGGSSCATATTAGIAALVWSVKPSMPREHVVNSLRNTAQNFPFMDSNQGYGKVNAYAAVNYALTHY